MGGGGGGVYRSTVISFQSYMTYCLTCFWNTSGGLAPRGERGERVVEGRDVTWGATGRTRGTRLVVYSVFAEREPRLPAQPPNLALVNGGSSGAA